MITEMEFGLAKRYQYDVEAMTAHAQAIINRKCAYISRLEAALAASQRELAIERGKRRLAELGRSSQ